MSLLCDEDYQWWLTVEQGFRPKAITWDIFKGAFQGKYIEASYIEAQRRKFMNLE